MESRIRIIVKNNTKIPLLFHRKDTDENTIYVGKTPELGHLIEKGSFAEITIQNGKVDEAQGTIEFTQDDDYFMSNLIWVCEGKLDVDSTSSTQRSSK